MNILVYTIVPVLVMGISLAYLPVLAYTIVRLGSAGYFRSKQQHTGDKTDGK